MNIPDEATNIAARTIASIEDTDGWEQWSDVAEAAIEASYPIVVSQALEDLVAELEDLPTGSEVKPGTWEYFAMFPLQHIRDHIEKLRKGTK